MLGGRDNIIELSQKMKHCVGFRINIHTGYMRRNPDAENPASHFQHTRYLRGSLKFTTNLNGKFHFLENQLDICLEVSNDFKHDLGIESGGGGGEGGASYNGQSKGGSAREALGI